jgi:M6 family metalloprotease-like protein
MSGIFGEYLTYTQGDGTSLRLVTFGDERYGRYETVDGYTVLYDEDVQAFSYAYQAPDGALLPTGVRADAEPPPDVPRHVHEALDRRNAWVRGRTELMLPQPTPGTPPADTEAMLTFGPDGGLLRGRKLDSGNVRGLTILVRFPDLDTTVGSNDVAEMLNAANYRAHGNVCSVNEYFARMSTGRLNFTNTVVGPYTLSRPRLAYASETRRGLLVPEAIQLAVDDGIDLTQFDSLGEGIVDSLSIMYAGRTEYRGDLWPHNWVHERFYGQVKTQLYTVTSMGGNPNELSIGTFCHEAGHMLMRWPDLYDYGELDREGDDFKSAGLGSFCVMAAGNHLDRGRTPGPVSVYLRDLSGWCANVVDIDGGGQFEAKQGDYDTVLRHRTSSDNEYFLIENRTQVGFDTFLPASGLAVYHCDKRGSNEFQQGTAARHYQCALLQADGRRDLESGGGNLGDGGDLFGRVEGTALSHATRPDSRTWAGTDSGLTISAISASGPMIRFRAGPVEAPAGPVIGQSQPAVDIPDERVGGVSDVIKFDGAGTVRDLRVQVDIEHKFVGDLRVELFSPTGRRAVLHDRTGRDTDDLHLDLRSEPPSVLQNLVGQPVGGDWRLTVSDLARADTGVLRQWRLEVTPGS